jgi:hypothetical protein
MARSAEIGRKVTAGDENMLRRAQKMLVDEFSTTSDISNVDELMEVLNGTRRCLHKDIAVK